MVPITFRFHHSFDLMSSSINYIFLKTSRQICRDHCQQFDFFQVMCRNSGWEIPSLPLDEIVLSSTIFLPPPNTNLFIFCDVSWFPLLSNLCYVLPWSITIFDVKNVVSITPPLKNSWYSDTSHHHHSFLVPVLFLNEIPTNGLWCVNSKLLATLLLWSYWSIVSFYVYGLMNHHSNIDCAT